MLFKGTIAYDASASDPDAGQSLVFSVSGTDSSLVTIDSDDGEIRLNNSANFEVKNSYSLNVMQQIMEVLHPQLVRLLLSIYQIKMIALKLQMT